MFCAMNQAGFNQNYMTCSEVEKLMGDNIKASVEVATRCIVTKIVEEIIEDAFVVGYDEQKRGIKTRITNTLEGNLTDIV